MYHEANVDYAAMIWEDLQYQIDYRHKKVRRREIMPYPRFNKAIIHHFMSQHKSISKREGSLYHTSADDGLLERLKFISKGELYQIYGKPILDTWIIDDIKKSEAYQMKKPSKKKQVLRDKSPESEGELENRQIGIKIRTPKAVVIKEPSSVPVKKTKESSGKLKGIEMLSEVAQLELITHKAIKESQCTSRLKHRTESSSEGSCVSPGVPDELIGKSTVSDEGVGTSPKNEDDDEDDVSKEEEDKEESVREEEEDEEESVSEEENVDEENQEEFDDDDNIFDITNTDDERT
ncbi:hypothetical protein Tco_1289741 [Tanacetum coccineum]